MDKTKKELLSQHVETIFKRFEDPGLHICDIATGGGKSYTIGKLTCEYYSQKFDRIIILCVQNKLVLGMNREIDKFIDLENSMLTSADKLVIENNFEVICKACLSTAFDDLFDQTGEELCFLIRSELQDMMPQQHAASAPRYYYGIAGIAKLLDCSEPTANRIKASGIIDGAITQVNRKIIVDGEKALALIRANGGRLASSDNLNV